MNTKTEFQKLAVQLALLAAMWVVPGFSQLRETPSVQPCLAAAGGLSDSPNLGSGEVDCGDFDRFYSAGKDKEGKQKTVYAVTVEIQSGKKCTATLWRNSRSEGGSLIGDPVDTAPPKNDKEKSLTVTAYDVQNLWLFCSGKEENDPCKFRITQITEDAPPKK